MVSQDSLVQTLPERSWAVRQPMDLGSMMSGHVDANKDSTVTYEENQDSKLKHPESVAKSASTTTASLNASVTKIEPNRGQIDASA